MTLSTLDVKTSVTADNQGNATILQAFTVPTGQFWLPNLVHVNTTNQHGVSLQSLPRATVSIGVPGSLSASEIIDSTFNAIDDTTGIVSGIIVPPGLAIKIQFTNCVPGDVLFARVIGSVSDVPPTIDYTPINPGSRFASSRIIDGATSQYDQNQVGVDVFPVSNAVFVVTPEAGSQPFPVTPTDLLQLHPNNIATFQATVAAGGNTVIIPAGNNLFLHTFQYDIDPGTNTTATWRVQDTAGTTLCPLHFEGVSTTAPSPRAPIDFKGFPNAAGKGIQLANASGASSAIFGMFSYSM